MKKVCQFYLNGNCKFGDKCKNLHQGNPQQNNHQSKGCTFFLTDSCNRPNCQYFHGYCEILEHVKKIENHKEPINNLINMDDTKFISSDEKTFYIRFSGNDDFHEETIAQGYKIGKLVYYSDKVICAIQKEGMIEEKNYIVIYNNEGYCMCETKNKPNDIFENSNTIITVEKDVIEVFEFSQIKDNNDKIINNLVKKSEINLDNNNNNNNFNNINSINNNNNNNNNIDNEILCIEYSQPGFFVCGHTSGLMSLWKPDPQVYLQKVQAQKLHDRAINKILYTKLSNDKSYLISCSSDKTVKVYDIEGNNVVKVQPFEDEVMDVKLVNDFNKNRVFIISLKNGKLFAMNEGFNPLFEIPSRFKTTITRHVIPLKNPLESETRGDLLAITELGKIDVFAWVKEGSINLNPHKNNNNPHNGFHNAPYNGPHNGPHNTPYNSPHNAPHNGPFNNNHPHFPYFSNPMFGPRGRYN